MKSYILLILATVLVNNFVLTRFLGICPFLGVSKSLLTPIGMSAAVIFVMTGASAVTWLLSHFFLQSTALFCIDLAYLQTIVFILVIATFVQFAELVIKRLSPSLYQGLGIYLPLITTNCAVLGAAVLIIKKELNFLEAIVFGIGAAIGFGIALIIFTGLREKINRANPPKAFQGTGIALVTAGLLSLAFMGFAALIKM